MEYTSIADTGIKASRIGLGTWAIGGTMWEARTKNINQNNPRRS